HRGRLPGAVRPEQADAGALGHLEVEAVDCGDRAVALDRAPEPDGQRAHAARMPAGRRGGDRQVLGGRDQAGVAARAALLLEVLLVVVLGLEELAGRDDLGRDPVRQPRLQVRPRREGLLLLLGRVEEHRRAVLAADVRPLAVALGRVVRAPEEVEQLLVRDVRRIELDLDRLGMAGRVGADVVVRGTVGVATGVADPGGGDAGNRAERRLDAPEAPGCECRLLCHAEQSRRPSRCYAWDRLDMSEGTGFSLSPGLPPAPPKGARTG